MRRILAALSVVGVAVGVVGCTAPVSDRPLVVVSTNILGDVVHQLVGDEAEVLTLMRPDADPHSFEISAREAARLRDADLLVSNGLGLEEGLLQHLDSAAAAGVETFVAGDAVDVIDYVVDASSGEGAQADPHLWTDPARMIDVVDALAPVLADIEGVDDDTVGIRTDRYREELVVLETEMNAAFAAIPSDRRALVTNHHVFGYLAERFDFDVVGAAIPGGTTLAAPSASDLASLVAAVETTGVSTIFAESSSPDRLMRALADEADVHVDVVELFTESLTGPDGGAPDYLTMMRVNTQRIAARLSP